MTAQEYVTKKWNEITPEQVTSLINEADDAGRYLYFGNRPNAPFCVDNDFFATAKAAAIFFLFLKKNKWNWNVLNELEKIEKF